MVKWIVVKSSWNGEKYHVECAQIPRLLYANRKFRLVGKAKFMRVSNTEYHVVMVNLKNDFLCKWSTIRVEMDIFLWRSFCSSTYIGGKREMSVLDVFIQTGGHVDNAGTPADGDAAIAEPP